MPRPTKKESQMFIYEQQLQKAILAHPDSGRLSCFVISNGTMYIDCAETFNTIHNSIINEFNLDLPMSGCESPEEMNGCESPEEMNGCGE